MGSLAGISPANVLCYLLLIRTFSCSLFSTTAVPCSLCAPAASLAVTVANFSRLLCLTTLGSRVPLLLLLLLLLLLYARLLVCCCWCTLLCWFARCVNAGGEHSRDRERGRVHESGHGEHQGFERLQVQWGDLFFYVCALPHAVLSWALRVGIFVSKTAFRTRGGCKNLGIDRARLSQLKKT